MSIRRKSLKNTIDLAYWKDKFYVIFKSGIVEVYTQSYTSSLIHSGTLNYEKEVSEGYFTQTGSVLLYVSQI